MHDLPAPRINKNSPAVMAARLAGYLEGVRAIGERLIEPPPTKRELQEAEREAHPEHIKHLKLRFAEGIPRIVSLQSVELLTHIRRVEYQLRCFILWLAAILVEKAQKNPDSYSSLFPAHAGISFGSTQPDPRLRRDERRSSEGLQVTTQAQLAGAAGDEQQASTISDYIWKQELQMRRLAAKTFPIGGFSITTPVIESTRRSRRSRMRHLTPDRSRTVDASYLVARLARLPRILARADQMAERLAKKALTFNNLDVKRAALSAFYVIRTDHENKRKRPPNPLYFEPLTRIVPPNKLWDSTEDDEERGDMTWLHYIASDTLNRTGFAPGPDAGSCLPDFSRFEPPRPPQVRGT